MSDQDDLVGLADEMRLAIYCFKTSFNPRICSSNEVMKCSLVQGNYAMYLLHIACASVQG